MKIGVVQPYFFPYLGYFQLAEAADQFIFYDNVQFIKGGWINRNRILINGDEHYITVPLKKASSNRLINEIEINTAGKFVSKTIKTIKQAYSKAPYLEAGISVVEEVLSNSETTISDMAIRSIVKTADYLGMNLNSAVCSNLEIDMAMDRSDRLVALTKMFGGTTYINPSGGRELYDPDYFHAHGISLKFLKAGLPVYDQGSSKDFIPGLSMIDILMHNAPEEIRKMLQSYELM